MGALSSGHLSGPSLRSMQACTDTCCRALWLGTWYAKHLHPAECNTSMCKCHSLGGVSNRSGSMGLHTGLRRAQAEGERSGGNRSARLQPETGGGCPGENNVVMCNIDLPNNLCYTQAFFYSNNCFNKVNSFLTLFVYLFVQNAALIRLC